MFSDLDKIVSRGNSESFQTPSNTIHIVDLNGQRLFYKLSKVSSMPLSKILHIATNKFKHSFSPVDYRSADQSKSFEKETSTLYKWFVSGISCIKPIDFSNEGIIFPFVDLPNVEFELNKSEDISLFRKTLDSYFLIREEAFKNDDPEMFHSDCHLRNFLVSNCSDREIIPIDPGFCIKKSLSTKELDAHINLYFMYNFFRLNNREFAEELAWNFSSDLSLSDKNNMKSINKPIPHAINSYLFLKEIALPYLKGSNPRENNTFKAYSPRNHALIQRILN